MSKREISAKDIVKDLRDGMDDAAVMKKYKLSPKGLESLFGKLLAAGLVTRTWIKARNLDREETVTLTDVRAKRADGNKPKRPRRKVPHPAFTGQIEEVDILEYLQLVLMNRKRTVLLVHSESGEWCRLFINNGSVIHAVSEEGEGEEAFYRCAQFQGGMFQHVPWSKPSKVTIAKPAEYLLLEAARRRDESF